MRYQRSLNSYCLTVVVIMLALLLVANWSTQRGRSQAQQSSRSVQHHRPRMQASGKIDGPRQAAIQNAYSRLPLSFEANQGQVDGSVKFLARGAGYTHFLTADEAVIALNKSGAKG